MATRQTPSSPLRHRVRPRTSTVVSSLSVGHADPGRLNPDGRLPTSSLGTKRPDRRRAQRTRMDLAMSGSESRPTTACSPPPSNTAADRAALQRRLRVPVRRRAIPRERLRRPVPRESGGCDRSPSAACEDVNMSATDHDPDAAMSHCEGLADQPDIDLEVRETRAPRQPVPMPARSSRRRGWRGGPGSSWPCGTRFGDTEARHVAGRISMYP